MSTNSISDLATLVSDVLGESASTGLSKHLFHNNLGAVESKIGTFLTYVEGLASVAEDTHANDTKQVNLSAEHEEDYDFIKKRRPLVKSVAVDAAKAAAALAKLQKALVAANKY